MRFLVLLVAVAAYAEVAIVVPGKATDVERLAAAELASYLGRMHPGEKFAVGAAAGAEYRVEFVRRTGPAESFAITHTARRATIAAADGRGALFAVYALLEKLGCGFYLSSETLPAARPFSFEGWTLEDAPVLAERIVFDWHNFLSSASTWEFEDWQRYIDASVRMRFNTLMVHAYGNNPMFTFRFRGVTKPVGYLATTRAGRDWGTEHVNDVRRLIGGELFSGPVFGASFAQAKDVQRLMQRVFEYAASRGMGITFALDVDTVSANDQAMIRTLPEAARIRSGEWELANPDTGEGYAFYKAQVDELLRLYPQITRLAVWFRNNNTPWTSVKREEFPESWRREFQGEAGEAFVFAVGKVARAYGRALREGGHTGVELASGTWRLELNGAADRYLPKEAAWLPLDWSTVFDTAAGQRQMRMVRSGRKVVPIIWAHHDDRTYIGRPYTPYVNFTRLMESAGAQGFGIIHWTTRPLDLYFKSTVVQSWRATRDEPLEKTCEEAAARMFGGVGREYLFRFLTEGPMFGRETTDRFMDIPLVEPRVHLRRAEERRKLLEGVAAGGAQLEYFRNYEAFIVQFFEAHTAYERAEAALKAGEYEKARAEIAAARPEEAIRAYVRAARSGQITRGEEALVVSLNLRWLPYFVSLRQAVGLEPVRVKFGRVEREPLAQGAGTLTFHFDEQGRVWRVLEPKGEAMEMGAILNMALRPGRYSVNGGAAVEARAGKVRVELKPGLEDVVIEAVR